MARALPGVGLDFGQALPADEIPVWFPCPPPSAHGGALRWSKKQACWTCRRHADDRLTHTVRKPKSNTLRHLPQHAKHRLLGGTKVSLTGPRNLDTFNRSQQRWLANEFILESVRTDLRHLGYMPPLEHGLFTYDAIMSSMHKGRALSELNPTSQTVIQGLNNIIAAFSPVPDSEQGFPMMAHVVFAALTVRRMGGKEFAKQYLSVLSKAAHIWRLGNQTGFPPLVRQGGRQTLSASALVKRSWSAPTHHSLAKLLKKDWSPESLRAVALQVAQTVHRQAGERPVTLAHMPHSLVGDCLAEWERHLGLC